MALYPIFLEYDVNVDEDYKDYTLDVKDNNDGIFENYSLYEFRQIFKQLKPNKKILDIIQENLKEFTDNMIGIHIRRTDGDFIKIKWNEVDNMLITKIEDMIKKEKNLKIFLATDSKETQDKYSEHFGDKLLSYIPEEDKFNNNRFNVICGVIDLFLLSKCNKMLIGTVGSSFSITAGLLGEADIWLIKDEKSKLPY
jgi:hypothetical protein